MGTGYTRKDTADNISDGNIINADDLDLEFNGVQAAFDSSTGHTHDGTDGEGAPIQQVGPNQEIVVTTTVVRPASNNTMDLGVATTNEFKNLYIDGTAYLDSVDIDGGTVNGLTELTVDNISLNNNVITTTNTDGNLNLRTNGDGVISISDADLKLADTDKVVFGTGSDLAIYHSGSDSYIDELGVGSLRIRTAGSVVMEHTDGTNGLLVDMGGEVQLYYNGATKLQTLDGGVLVTGDLSASADIVGGNDLYLTTDSSRIVFGTDGEVVLQHVSDFGLRIANTNTSDDSFPVVSFQSNQDTITVGEDIGRINFNTVTAAGGVGDGTQARINIDATGTHSATTAGSRMEFWTTTASGTLTRSLYLDEEQNARLADNQKLKFGAGDDLQIYHDGSKSYIDDLGTGEIVMRTNRFIIQDVTGTETLARFDQNSFGKLYYDDSQKLATTNTGVDITGELSLDTRITIDGGTGNASMELGGANGAFIDFKEPLSEDFNGRIIYTDSSGFILGGNTGIPVKLAYGGFGTSNVKLATTNTGVDVTGHITSDKLSIGTSTFPNGVTRVAIQGTDGASGATVNVAADEFFIDNDGDTGMTLGSAADGIAYYAFADPDVAIRSGMFYDHAEDKLGFRSASATRMTIDSSGRVGIGSNTPAEELEVHSTGDATVLVKTSGTGDADATLQLDSADSGESVVSFMHDGVEGAKIEWFTDGTPDLNIATNTGTGGVIDFQPNNSLAMRIAADGRVGIFQSDPQYALDVSGAGRFKRTNNDANLILETTDADSGTGPVLNLLRNPGHAGVANDQLGKIQFRGMNSAVEDTRYAEIYSQIIDPADGAENVNLVLAATKDGTLRSVFNANMDTAEIVINNAGLDVDFRVESEDDTAAFFVEGATGNIGFSVTDPDSHTPQTHNPNKRSIVSYFGGGSQYVCGRSDSSANTDDFIGAYLFKTNDTSGIRFGGMSAKVDDSTGNGVLEFYPVTTAYDSTATVEGIMQLTDGNDLYLRAGGIKLGRSEKNVYSTSEEAVSIFHNGSGSGDTHTSINARDGTAGDHVFRHQRQGVVKSEIEENGDFLSATDSYGAVSDGRLKENIVDSGSQWDDIKALQIKKYSFIADELAAPNMLGVVAQDLLASGMTGLVKQKFKTDAEDNPILDSDGNPDYIYTVKGSVMQMKALKALQEAMAKIEVLEAKVAALESA